MNRSTRVRAVLPVLALSLALTACGDDEENTTAENNPEPTPSADHSMEPEAGPLKAGTYTGTFSLLDAAPDGTKKIGGTATMVVSKSKTTANISATGLDPKAVYVVHLHKAACSADGGGTHFMFDHMGEPKPPNEVWITPGKVSGGKATGKTEAKKQVTKDAKSMVIHLKRPAGATKDEKTPPKLACADLAPKKA